MAATGSHSKRRVAPPADDDVPLLVRVLAGNPVTGVSVLSCLYAADTCALRRLHVAVAGVVACVPWADTTTPMVDPVRWRAALPATVGARLSKDLRFSDAVVAALAGVTRLDLRNCRKVTDKVLRSLPTSLRTLNVHGCYQLTDHASIAHLSALVSLDCRETSVAAAGLPSSLQELKLRCLYSHNNGLASLSLVHLSQLRVLHASMVNLDAATLASLPPSLVELDVRDCERLTAAASFAHLHALQRLNAFESDLSDAALATLPPSLVYLNVAECANLTPAAVLPLLPALRVLDVSGTDVGDALVVSLPVGLEELRMVSCHCVTARATLGHVPALRALYSMGTALAPAVIAACRARGCAVPAAGDVCGYEDYWTAVALMTDGRLAIGGDNGNVWVWDAAAGGDATAVLKASGTVHALAVLPDGRRLAASVEEDDEDMTPYIEVWDVAATLPIQVAVIPCDSTVWALAVLADGRLATGCHDGKIEVVNVDTGAVAVVLEGHSRKVTVMAVAPGGALASGSKDGTVCVWDIGRSLCVAELVGRNGGVQSLAVLVDGRLASGAANGVIALWDVGSRTCVSELVGHGGPVTALAALPDGRLVSGCNEGVVQLWDTRAVAAAAVAGSSRVAGIVTVTVLAKVPRGSDALLPLPDGRLACACNDADEIFLLQVPPPATCE